MRHISNAGIEKVIILLSRRITPDMGIEDHLVEVTEMVEIRKAGMSNY